MAHPGGRLEEREEGQPLTYAMYMAATPEERRQYVQYAWDAGERSGFTDGAHNAAAALRNIVGDDHSATPLSADQYRTILTSSGLAPDMMQAIGGQLGGILTQQAQDDAHDDFIDSPIMPLALTALAGGLGLAGAGAFGGGAAASGGATAAGAGAAETGLEAAGIESLLGPATGTVEAAPVIGAAGAPTVSGVASGAGPFVPVVGGMTGASDAVSRFLSPSASAGGTSVSGTAAATGGSSAAVARILRGEGTLDDYLSVGGAAAPGVISAIGSDRQASSLEGLAREYMAQGAPSRARFESSFAPGFTMASDPGYKDALDQTTKSFLHKASISGNPAESPNAWTQTLKDVNASFAYPALKDFRSMNANAGGLATFAPAAVDASGAAIGAEGKVLSDLGGAAGDVFSPPKTGAQSLVELLRSLR